MFVSLLFAQTANDMADDGMAGSALFVRKDLYHLPATCTWTQKQAVKYQLLILLNNFVHHSSTTKKLIVFLFQIVYVTAGHFEP
jgi:hypothetical protein